MKKRISENRRVTLTLGQLKRLVKEEAKTDAAFLSAMAKKSEKDFQIENNVLVKYLGKGGNVVVPVGVEEIDDHAFEDCTALSTVQLPNSLTRIGWYAFANTGLKEVTIPASVKEIEDGAFSGCEKLRYVILNSRSTTIQGGAFEACVVKEIRFMP